MFSMEHNSLLLFLIIKTFVTYYTTIACYLWGTAVSLRVGAKSFSSEMLTMSNIERNDLLS